MSVGIIIPTFEAFDYCRLAIESAGRTPNATIIIIDDASRTWPGVGKISEMVPSGVPFVVQRYDHNGGLSRSWNSGLRLCKSMGLDYAVCGNSDLVFPVGWWRPLETSLERFVFVGPVTNAPGHSQSQDVTEYLKSYELSDKWESINQTQRQLKELNSETFGRSLLNGFCFAGKTASFFSVDDLPFDERIPLAGNEDDFFTRAAEQGLSGAIVPQSFVFHYRSVSRGLTDRRRHLEKGAVRLEPCQGCGKENPYGV